MINHKIKSNKMNLTRKLNLSFKNHKRILKYYKIYMTIDVYNLFLIKCFIKFDNIKKYKIRKKLKMGSNFICFI
jgi:hypothetical protein